MVEAGDRRPLAAETRVATLGPGLAEEATADHDEVGTHPGEARVVESPTRHHAGGEVLGDHVGPLLDQPTNQRHAGGLLHVDGEALLVGVQEREHGRLLEDVRLGPVLGRHVQKPQEVRAPG
jgi:hypothetical protein